MASSNLIIPFKSTDLGAVVFTGTELKVDYNTGNAKVDVDTGLPVYRVLVSVLQSDGNTMVNMVVNVPTQTDPSAVIKPLTYVVFDNIECMTGEMMVGKGENRHKEKFVSFSADAVRPLQQHKQ